jgi:predicted acylesterase/phospholipase RssA
MWKPRTLILGPGGVKGFLLLGFLTVLEDNDILKTVDTFCGVSVGAAISMLYIIGYSMRDIITSVYMVDIFKDVNIFDISNIISKYGLTENNELKNVLTDLVLKKYDNIPTLYELYTKTGKSLTILSSNITTECDVLFTPFSHPDLSIIDAVLMSSNIPYIFSCITFENCHYSDGIFSNPYPIEYFDDQQTDILGVFIKNKPENVTNILNYTKKLFYLPIDQLRNNSIRKSILSSSDKCKHVKLEISDLKIVNFKVSVESKLKMIISGWNIGTRFIKDISNNEYEHPKISNDIKYKYPELYKKS